MNISFPRKLVVHNYDCLDYDDALQMQYDMHRARVEQSIDDSLLLLEHPPVFTMGKHAVSADILAPQSQLDREGITVHTIDRGGFITYHGPGQMVAYIIIDLGLHCRRVRQFIYQIEQSVIDSLKTCYNIDATRAAGYPGVWVGGEKIAAVGISLSGRVSMHGLALNIQPNLQHFQLIVPCGIKNKRITSVEQLLGHEVDMSKVKSTFTRLFADIFGYAQVET